MAPNPTIINPNQMYEQKEFVPTGAHGSSAVAFPSPGGLKLVNIGGRSNFEATAAALMPVFLEHQLDDAELELNDAITLAADLSIQSAETLYARLNAFHDSKAKAASAPAEAPKEEAEPVEEATTAGPEPEEVEEVEPTKAVEGELITEV